jgi:hypothetical protein
MTDKTEIQLLKERADAADINYAGNVSLVKLKELLGDVPAPVAVKVASIKKVEPVVQKQGTPEEVARDLARLRQTVVAQKRKEANRLVRVSITCMNPDKGEHPGEIFTVSNNVIGTVRKFVPFNSDQPFHVPQMILNVMKERKCQIFVSKQLSNGSKIKVGKLIREFAIQVEDPMTTDELQTLKTKQLAEGSLND